MNKNLNEWLDGATAEELKGLISAYEAEASVAACDLPRLKKAVMIKCGLKKPTGKRSFLRVGFPILAACACLCLIGGGIFRGMIQRAEDPVVIPNQSEETDGNAEESQSDPRPSGMEEWLNQFEKDKIVWGEVQEEKPVETSDSPETDVPPDGESQNPVQTDAPLWEDPGSQVSEYYDWHGLELQYYLYVQIINTPADSSNLFAIKVDSAGEKAKAILEESGAYDYRGNLFLICNIKTLRDIAENAEDDAFDGAFFFLATRQDLGLEDPEPIIPNATDAPVLDETGMEWGTSVPDTDGWGWEDETIAVLPDPDTTDYFETTDSFEMWEGEYEEEDLVNYNTLYITQSLLTEMLNAPSITDTFKIGVRPFGSMEDGFVYQGKTVAQWEEEYFLAAIRYKQLMYLKEKFDKDWMLIKTDPEQEKRFTELLADMEAESGMDVSSYLIYLDSPEQIDADIAAAEQTSDLLYGELKNGRAQCREEWTRYMVAFLSRASADGWVEQRDAGLITVFHTRSFDVLFEALIAGEQGVGYLQSSYYTLIE